MAKKYRNPRDFPVKVEGLPPVTATALKNSSADVLDLVAAHGAVAITRHDKPRAVLLSLEQYQIMRGDESDLLTDLHVEYQSMLEKMQDPAQRAAAKRLFEATPEELGAAAVRAARRKGNDNSAEADPTDGQPPRPVLLLEMKRHKITAPDDLSGAPDWAQPIIAAAIRLHTLPT